MWGLNGHASKRTMRHDTRRTSARKWGNRRLRHSEALALAIARSAAEPSTCSSSREHRSCSMSWRSARKPWLGCAAAGGHPVLPPVSHRFTHPCLIRRALQQSASRRRTMTAAWLARRPESPRCSLALPAIAVRRLAPSPTLASGRRSTLVKSARARHRHCLGMIRSSYASHAQGLNRQNSSYG